MSLKDADAFGADEFVVVLLGFADQGLLRVTDVVGQTLNVIFVRLYQDCLARQRVFGLGGSDFFEVEFEF